MHETSAGGLVIDNIDRPREEQVAALIGRVDRRGRMLWSLPKGHIELGETAEQTAIREVAEETGIQGSVLAALGRIDYWFVTDGRRVHKTVHHYLMRFSGGELSDDDVEVAEVAWVPIPELPSRLAYADERKLAEVADELIDKLQSDGPAALPPLPPSSPRRRPQTHSRTRNPSGRRVRSRPEERSRSRAVAAITMQSNSRWGHHPLAGMSSGSAAPRLRRAAWCARAGGAHPGRPGHRRRCPPPPRASPAPRRSSRSA